MTILVTGATGNVGRLVVDRLVEAGVTVRALTRDPDAAALPVGVEVAAGDLSRPQSLTEALDGVRRMYLFPVARTAREVVGLAERAGVRRIVVLSSGAVTTGHDTGFHLPVERAVEASGLEWTHVRPGEFALNKLWLWGPSIRAERVVRDPYPMAAGYPIHEMDIADVAAAALLGDGHTGRAYTLCGPAPIDNREQVRVIAEALGEEIRFERVTPDRAREIYRKQGGFAAANAGFLLGFEDYSGVEVDPSDAHGKWRHEAPVEMPTAEAVTGRPARTFAQWARDHARDFR
ncbi:NAD(P)H-binding protein [Microbispora sp. CA-135349]|uniref:NAD(P)H-binding protein n=1 Tax=Microbispora sp. CA-135349 TaxID=3239953 RepID=UPI003D89C6DB